MKVLFYILGTLIFLLGGAMAFFSLFEPVLQLTLWVLVTLIGAVFLCAAGIMGSIEQLLPKTDYKALAAQKSATEKT